MCSSCVGSQKLRYCLQCYNCEDCFGCVGLQRKKFCILNQQYEEVEYQKLVEEIKAKMIEAKEYGEFFPLSFSPVYFGESAAVLYYLATKEDGKKLGALDFDPESSGAIGELADASKLRRSSEIPDSVAEMNIEDWVGVPILDEQINRRFAFLRPELEFYKKYRIALPNQHFIHRMQDLIQEANSAVFENQICKKCKKEMLVSINKKFPARTIYCRQCFDVYYEANG